MLALTLHPLMAVSVVVLVIAAFFLLLAWALFFCGAKDDRQTDRERAKRIAQISDLQAHRARKLRGGL